MPPSGNVMHCAILFVFIWFHYSSIFVVVVAANAAELIWFSVFSNVPKRYTDILLQKMNNNWIQYVCIFQYLCTVCSFPISVLVVFSFWMRADIIVSSLGFILRRVVFFSVEFALFYSSRFWTEDAHKYPHFFFLQWLYSLFWHCIIIVTQNRSKRFNLLLRIVKLEWVHLQGYNHSNKCMK